MLVDKTHFSSSKFSFVAFSNNIYISILVVKKEIFVSKTDRDRKPDNCCVLVPNKEGQ